MSKLTDVIDAMRVAGGSKARFTAGWIELSCAHKGLHDALKAVFRRKPTGQRLGLWLSENVGEQSGEMTLQGRHSTNAKAWRYAVRLPTETAESLEAQARAVKQAANHGPAPLQVQIAAPSSVHNPHTSATPQRDYVLRPGPDGQPIKVPDLPAPKAAPEVKLEEPPKPPTRTDELREKYLAHHSRPEGAGVATSEGFYNPGGVVGFNINNEGARGRNVCRVAGVWPGGRR